MRSANREHRESGDNPGWYRRCVCIGFLLVDESQSLRNWEGRAGIRDFFLRCISQKTCLEKAPLVATGGVYFVAGNRLRQLFSCRSFLEVIGWDGH